jgi:hypothetical protein
MKDSETGGTRNALGDMRNAVTACISHCLRDIDTVDKRGSNIKVNHREIYCGELD